MSIPSPQRSIPTVHATQKVSYARKVLKTGYWRFAELLAEHLREEYPWHPRVAHLSFLLWSRRLATKWAYSLLQPVAQGGSGDPEAAHAMAVAMRQMGRYSDSARVTSKLEPGETKSLDSIVIESLSLLQARQYREAHRTLKAAVESDPSNPIFQDLLGESLIRLGFPNEAARAFQKAIDLSPETRSYHAHLGDALISASEPAAAQRCAEHLVALDPKDPIARYLLAQTLVSLNKEEQAEAETRVALQLDPLDPFAYSLRGSILQVVGDMKEAVSMFETSISLNPLQGSSYWGLVRSRKMTETDKPMVEKMASVALIPELEESEVGLLEYGLGKAFEDLERYEESMRHYDRANFLAYRQKFGTKEYNPEQIDDYVREMGEIYTREFVERHRPEGLPDDLPIFVVGMMRSGTTLAEQILSCHSMVGAAGEQPFWTKHRSFLRKVGSEEVDIAPLRPLAEEYLGTLRDIAPGKPRVVDKMPTNHMHLGMIHLAFPNAKIVHMIRDPRDICLSIYTTQNRVRIPWAHSKENIAYWYQAYRRSIDLWREVLPEGTILDVSYESLASHPETEIPRMLEFCGLPWEEACLQPQENKRAVATPSLCQVRRPIYTSSIQRWKNFEPWLGEIAELRPS